jgi:hypothetical protein
VPTDPGLVQQRTCNDHENLCYGMQRPHDKICATTNEC